MNTGNIQSSYDLLSSEIKSFIEWADGVEKNEKLNHEFDLRLRLRESELVKKETNLTSLELKLKSENLLIETRFNDLEKDKSKLKGLEIKIEELKKLEKLITEKHLNLDSREQTISKKEKEIEELLLMKDELDHRERLLKKEMLMDKIRQDKMDEREKDLEKEKERLQIIANNLNAIKK